MPNLDTQDRVKLVDILQNVGELQTTYGRQQALELAGLGELVPSLNLEGTPRTVVTGIVTQLEGYGRVSFDQHALGRLLVAMRSNFGKADEKRQTIDRILATYELMTPPTDQPSPKDVVDIDLGALPEKIIGENTLRPVAFLQRGTEVARSVALVRLPSHVGTGFLIDRCLFVTCNHVISSRDEAKTAVFQFNFQEDIHGRAMPITEYLADNDGFFHTNGDLDYTIIELLDAPGTTWGFVPISEDRPTVDRRVNIIQHPNGLPKQISFQNNFVEYTDDRLVQYVTSTNPGSSGAPVLDDYWRAVAVHRAGGMLSEPDTKRRYFRNEGSLFSAIIEDLPEETRTDLRNVNSRSSK